MQITADYIIVGGGSAGCVLAARLSEDPDVQVILLEAGGGHRAARILLPLGAFWLLGNPRYDWCFETVPQPELNGRSIKVPRGRVLGGSSSINGLTYIRGQAADYDDWARCGAVGWAYEEVLPYFIKLETNDISGPFHGETGPVRVSKVPYTSPLADSWIEACNQRGIPTNDDFNGARQEGAGYYQVTAWRGLRNSAARAYLDPARKRPNLRVITGARARRIIIENGRAKGVEAVIRNAPAILTAREETIVCAGTIQTPHLLMLSGIGPRAVLRRNRIPVVLDREEVGENLQDHLDLSIIYGTPTGSSLFSEFSITGAVRHGLEYAIRRRGPLACVTAPVGVFARSSETVDRPDLQYHIALFGSLRHGDEILRRDALSAQVCPMRPSSRGRVSLTGADPEKPPLISPNFLSTTYDQKTFIDGVHLTREIAASPAFARYNEGELYPGPSVDTPEAILAYLRDQAESVYHPVGTCRMGSDLDAVVDPWLRVNGVDGLRVVDASVMPSLVSGNTNAPTMMIAERAADFIKLGRGSSAEPANAALTPIPPA